MSRNAKHHDRAKPRTTAREIALRIVESLQRAGHVAYWAGGCVRDQLRGEEPQDYDIATSARPDDVCKLFRSTRKVGAQFGVVLVRMSGRDFEVATFRTDHDYADGRRPTGVSFSTPEQDATRRDFTINGMFFDPVADALHDYVGGAADISAGVIRAIGDPEARFAEDHLRILRAVKFASRFAYDIEPITWTAMRASASSLPRISPERIRMELEAILSRAGRAAAVQMLADCGALAYLWPGAQEMLGDLPRTIDILNALPSDAGFDLSLAAMLSSKDVDVAATTCQSLRCSNQTTDRVTWLITHRSAFDDSDGVTLADLKLLMANAGFDELLSLAAALHAVDERPAELTESIRRRATAIPRLRIAPPPLVTGDDLAQMGLTPGPIYKTILDRVYYEQLNDEITSREAALARARALAANE